MMKLRGLFGVKLTLMVVEWKFSVPIVADT
jgi:hypothetical protein